MNLASAKDGGVAHTPLPPAKQDLASICMSSQSPLTVASTAPGYAPSLSSRSTGEG
jgi:hypothetical protein